MKYVHQLAFFVVMGLSTSVYAGGVSGGGGDTLPDDPIPAEWVTYNLKIARKTLIVYFQGAQIARRPEFQDLFKTSPDRIFQVLRSTGIEARLSGPCIDESGNENDGSSTSSSPDKICISVERLRNKLIEGNVRYQTLALVVHEMSHRMGYDEAQADVLQRAVIRDLRGETIYVNATDTARDLETRIGKFQEVLDRTSDDDSHLTKPIMGAYWSAIFNGPSVTSPLPQLRDHGQDRGLGRLMWSYLAADSFKIFLTQWLTLEASYYGGLQDVGFDITSVFSDEECTRILIDYRTAFAHENSISIKNYWPAMSSNSIYQHLDPNVTLARLSRNKAIRDVRTILKNAIKEFSKLQQLIEDLDQIEY